jgi:hypothetical protein
VQRLGLNGGVASVRSVDFRNASLQAAAGSVLLHRFLVLNPVSWFEIGLVKSTPNMSDGIPLHIKRLCVIERMHASTEWLKAHAHQSSSANMLGGSTHRFRATTSRARIAPESRDGEVSASKAGRSALGRSSGCCRRHPRTGHPGQFLPLATGGFTAGQLTVDVSLEEGRGRPTHGAVPLRASHSATVAGRIPRGWLGRWQHCRAARFRAPQLIALSPFGIEHTSQG